MSQGITNAIETLKAERGKIDQALAALESLNGENAGGGQCKRDGRQAGQSRA